MLLRDIEVERYWYMPASYTKERRELEIDKMIMSGNYAFQLKTDGNYGALVCDFDGEKMLLGRGISKVSGTYTHYEDNVFFFDAFAATFNKPTRLIGEIYLDGGIDRHVGSILRAKPLKALCIQDKNFYLETSKIHKFTAKDRRDIEGNEFFGNKLKYRIFDCLYFNGEDLMSSPWIERQKYVKLAAEQLNNPLISYVPYFEMDDTFRDKLGEILSNGGEGVVCYLKNGKPEPGARTAHKTCKVKQEIESKIDCFIIGTEPATKDYTGKELEHWQFWENIRTGEKLIGDYYTEYRLGDTLTPITQGYYNNWPGAINVGVYDHTHKIIPLCKVAGLTEEFKEELRDNFNEWYMCPLTIGGMMISTANSNGIPSVRHPYLSSIRKGDISADDCTLAKIYNN